MTNRIVQSLLTERNYKIVIFLLKQLGYDINKTLYIGISYDNKLIFGLYDREFVDDCFLHEFEYHYIINLNEHE
jgi:hypothetical protein